MFQPPRRPCAAREQTRFHFSVQNSSPLLRCSPVKERSLSLNSNQHPFTLFFKAAPPPPSLLDAQTKNGWTINFHGGLNYECVVSASDQKGKEKKPSAIHSFIQTATTAATTTKTPTTTLKFTKKIIEWSNEFATYIIKITTTSTTIRWLSKMNGPDLFGG